MDSQIIITYFEGKETPHQIAFIENGIFTDVEPYEEKHHSKYLEEATKKIYSQKSSCKNFSGGVLHIF